MKFNELRTKLLQKPEFKKEYERYDLAFEIASMVLEWRILRGMSQEELANRIGTKQASIARLENGSTLPSLSFLNRIAKELNIQLKVEWESI